MPIDCPVVACRLELAMAQQAADAAAQRDLLDSEITRLREHCAVLQQELVAHGDNMIAKAASAPSGITGTLVYGNVCLFICYFQ